MITVVVSVDLDTSGGLAAYWVGNDPVIAPRGWDCEVNVARDGSRNVVITGPERAGQMRFTIYSWIAARTMADLA